MRKIMVAVSLGLSMALSAPALGDVGVEAQVPVTPPVPVPALPALPEIPQVLPVPAPARAIPATPAPVHAIVAPAAPAAHSTTSGAATRTTPVPAPVSSTPPAPASGGAGDRPRARATGTPRSAHAARAHEERLRHLVARADGCLSGLRYIQARVLVLRAALDRPKTRPRAVVARRLSISSHRVRHLERTGLRHLAAMYRQSGCPDAQGSTGTGTAASSTEFASLTPGGAPPNAGSSPPASSAQDSTASHTRGGVRGAQASKARPGTAVNPIQLAPIRKSDATPWILGLGGALLLGFAARAWLDRRRRRRLIRRY